MNYKVTPTQTLDISNPITHKIPSPLFQHHFSYSILSTICKDEPFLAATTKKNALPFQHWVTAL